ncbi:MAG: hypothetical protein ACI9QQ_001517, partial [Myxococcota bacterium]
RLRCKEQSKERFAGAADSTFYSPMVWVSMM